MCVVRLVGDRARYIRYSLIAQGAAEALYHVSQRLGLLILPYVVLLVIPVLGRMSDHNDDVRRIISATFASLLRIMPLEQGFPDPPGLAAGLIAQKQRYAI